MNRRKGAGPAQARGVAAHSSPQGRSEVLCVGAYERDNFGDLLFLEVTQALLGGAQVTASSIIAADMTAEFGRSVTAYGHDLRSHEYDVVWSVGGELGRVNTSTALKYSLPPALWEVVTKLDAADRLELVTQLTGMPHQDLAYVPELSQFPLNSGARQVVHSAGLSGIASLGEEQQAAVVDRLSRAASVTVRDRESGEVLSGLGIDADVSPDVVHALPLLFPSLTENPHDDICFHAAATYLSRAGTQRVGKALGELATRVGTGVLLFVAGTANGHDSIDSYRQIQEYLASEYPGVPVRISQSRDPLTLAQEVMGARIWIGTSLHGRIIAGSAGVPRISLSKAINRSDLNEKTSRYSRSWDQTMPFATTLDGISEAYDLALQEDTKEQAADEGRALATTALVAGRRVAERVLPART